MSDVVVNVSVESLKAFAIGKEPLIAGEVA